jgi:hypothetical protein
MAATPPVEARYSQFHNFSMTAVSVLLLGFVGVYLSNLPEKADATATDSRVVLYVVLGVAMIYYGVTGFRRGLDRTPQVVIDAQGIYLGFGRAKRFAWDEIQWVKLHRIAIRPQLHIGIVPEALLAANLGLSTWNLDDALKGIRGMPAAVALRDNGLDTRSASLLDAVRRFRPDLVRS